ncbi:hypothetical protein SKAU_G00363790 [Synaphobranchus kaupii]|uniref:Uncharacterized protein n=1 Tax=Synaphobranchus kaupii TaxID=118154 RepID=A0A9Q1EIT6_SYNKA|nr:hypothetical protein SKAU_G00363790 [Synaphobranchus kaupii]
MFPILNNVADEHFCLETEERVLRQGKEARLQRLLANASNYGAKKSVRSFPRIPWRSLQLSSSHNPCHSPANDSKRISAFSA